MTFFFFAKISHLSIPLRLYNFVMNCELQNQPESTEQREKKLHSTSAAAAAASFTNFTAMFKMHRVLRFFHDKMQQCFLRFHKAFFYEIISIVQSLFFLPSLYAALSFFSSMFHKEFIFSCFFLFLNKIKNYCNTLYYNFVKKIVRKKNMERALEADFLWWKCQSYNKNSSFMKESHYNLKVDCTFECSRS